jgi:hypothetical protein
MNDTNFTVTTETSTKVTITITRQQLWINYVNCWRDIIWDDASIGFNCLQSVASVLLSGTHLDVLKLRKLFRDGDTVLFMGDLMQYLDTSENNKILREIIVTDIDDDGITKNYVIPHSHIIF